MFALAPSCDPSCGGRSVRRARDDEVDAPWARRGRRSRTSPSMTCLFGNGSVRRSVRSRGFLSERGNVGQLMSDAARLSSAVRSLSVVARMNLLSVVATGVRWHRRSMASPAVSCSPVHPTARSSCETERRPRRPAMSLRTRSGTTVRTTGAWLMLGAPSAPRFVDGGIKVATVTRTDLLRTYNLPPRRGRRCTGGRPACAVMVRARFRP
jgi:hypothetical protein